MNARHNILLAAFILLTLLMVPVISCHRGSEPVTVDLQDLKYSDPATVDNSNLPLSSIEELHTTGQPPDIDVQQYRLVVDGLVEHPLSLTYSEVLSRPSVAKLVLLICFGFFVDNAEWTGIPVNLLLEEAMAKPEAKAVAFYGADGYSQTLSLEEAQIDGVFLAHHVNGEVLPLEHGYPLRLVVEGKYGNFWVKWVHHIEVLG